MLLDSFKSQIVIRNQMPLDRLDTANNFLIYDSILLGRDSSEMPVKAFIESFPHRLGLRGGEAIKNFRDFPKHLDQVLKNWPQPISRQHSLVVLGGGSLGDFGGFLASILKRGVGLVHIPTTWVAAMDSSHGGKTALNIDSIKNQIGTFYPAQKVFIVKEILENTPLELKEESYGELIKMALIGESQFYRELRFEKRPAQDFLWRFTKFCIEDKYHVILQDPYEQKRLRQVLNFGHTLGHVLESYFSWPHGDSVMQGIFFALEWSRYRGDLSQNLYDEIMGTIAQKFNRVPAHQLSWYRPPREKAVRPLLMSDKKAGLKGDITFVFLKGIGKPDLKKVKVDDLLSEAKRQSWVK